MKDVFDKHFLTENVFCPRIKQAGKFSVSVNIKYTTNPPLPVITRDNA